MITNPAPIQDLVRLLQTGKFADLIKQAEASIRISPNTGPIWHLLGLGYLNLGQSIEAVTPLKRAAELMAKDADVLEHLGIAQLQAGDKVASFNSFERCLRLNPASFNVLINLASLANDLGRFRLAEKHASAALRKNADLPEALFNLGRALRGLGRTTDAIDAFRRTLTFTANSPIAQNDVGLQFVELGDPSAAEACFRTAIAIAPDYAPAHANLGRALELSGRTANALAAYRQAITLAPQLAGAHANLASLLNSVRRFAEAEAACLLAIQIDPKLAVAHCNLGTALFAQRRLSEAESSFRRALFLQPGMADALNNLGNLLQETKRFDEAVACYRQLVERNTDNGEALIQAYHCANHLCDWSHRAEDETALVKLVRSGNTNIFPFGLLSLDVSDAASLQKEAARQVALHLYSKHFACPPMAFPDSRRSRDRLRIGYLSADFHDHATMHLLGGVLAAHDRSRFAIHLYSYGPNTNDDGRQKALAAAEIFRDVGSLSDQDAASQIATDQIDILVDLKGYTQDNRLGISALRPAPIIVSWLGYPGTLGHERLADYIIGDPVVTPMEHAAQYSEKIIQMPDCYQPNDQQREIGRCPTRAEAGLPDTGTVFCSFNQSYKITPTVFSLWCQILLSVPDSVLWLLKPPPVAIDNLQREAKARGIDANRLIFAEPLPLKEHLGRLQLANLALDTAPYGSHTTGSDALWAGVPLITMPTMAFSSRVAASLLAAVGMQELVAKDSKGYLEIASQLGGNPSKLQELRTRLSSVCLTSALFDTTEFTQNLESIYLNLFSTPVSLNGLGRPRPRNENL